MLVETNAFASFAYGATGAIIASVALFVRDPEREQRRPKSMMVLRLGIVAVTAGAIAVLMQAADMRIAFFIGAGVSADAASGIDANRVGGQTGGSTSGDNHQSRGRG